MTEDRRIVLSAVLRKCIVLSMLVLLVFQGTVWAEYERGDLSARFDDDVTITYNDVLYRQKSRMTTVQFVGVAEEENGGYRAEMLILLAVDDNRKLITPIRIDTALLQDGIVIPKNGEGFLLDEEGVKDTCAEALQKVNDFLPAEVAEHYLFFDFQGLTVMDGLQTDNYEDRMRAIKNQVESMTAEQMNDLFVELSDFIVTDMKSGALIKVMDKAERYDRTGMIELTTEAERDETDPDSVVYSEDVMLKLIVDVFFEEKVW